MFVGILPLTSPISATRASLGCVLAIASVAYYREEVGAQENDSALLDRYSFVLDANLMRRMTVHL